LASPYTAPGRLPSVKDAINFRTPKVPSTAPKPTKLEGTTFQIEQLKRETELLKQLLDNAL